MYRFVVDDLQEAMRALDEEMIEYDFDSDDRIMISEQYRDEAVRAWENCGIDYSEI